MHRSTSIYTQIQDWVVPEGVEAAIGYPFWVLLGLGSQVVAYCCVDWGVCSIETLYNG